MVTFDYMLVSRTISSSLCNCPIAVTQLQENAACLQPRGIMFAGPLFSVLSLCTIVVLAKPLQMSTAEKPSASLSSGVVDAAFVSNISTGSSALNMTAENAFNIECDGNRYGFNPNIADCEGAVQTIAPEWEPFVWGQRHTGLPVGTFTLPFAVFGGKSYGQ